MLNFVGDNDVWDVATWGGGADHTEFPSQLIYASQVINHEGYNPKTFENGSSVT